MMNDVIRNASLQCRRTVVASRGLQFLMHESLEGFLCLKWSFNDTWISPTLTVVEYQARPEMYHLNKLNSPRYEQIVSQRIYSSGSAMNIVELLKPHICHHQAAALSFELFQGVERRLCASDKLWFVSISALMNSVVKLRLHEWVSMRASLARNMQKKRC